VDLFEALQYVNEGGRISRGEWGDKGFFVEIHAQVLCLHKPDGIYHPWILTQDDFDATDFEILTDG
jgi:hypothetical protein